MSFDPGAKRMGWSVIKGDGKSTPTWQGSGIATFERDEKEKFQVYRLRVIDFWVTRTGELLNSYKPDELINETVPAVGGGNFVVATQSYLANVAITTIQTIARAKGYLVKQIGATTVKKKIGRAKNATKVKVRNGIYEIMPEMKTRHTQWTQPKCMDEPDAIAVALTHLGYELR